MDHYDLSSYLKFLQKNKTDVYDALVELAIKSLEDLNITVVDEKVAVTSIWNFPPDVILNDNNNSDIYDKVTTVTPTPENDISSENVLDFDRIGHGVISGDGPTFGDNGLGSDKCANNTDTIVPNYYDYTQIASVRYIFIILYIIVIVVSFVGNLMVIWTVTRNKYMRTVTNYYIRNLAVCDLLVASVVMPLKLLEYTAPCSWQVFANDALCSVMSYILPVFVFASVLTLVAISLER